MLSVDMNQVKQQERTAVPATPRARKDWEWFWRIVAGLMLLIIAWAAWVLYQIMPRSVVTPLAYSAPVRPIGVLHSTGGVSAIAPTVPMSPPAPTEADLALDRAQAAARAGAHQASADVQAAGLTQEDDRTVGPGLRLATEIAAPPAEKNSILKTQEGRGAAGNDRP